MASKATSIALLLILNILFFTLVSSGCPPSPPPPSHSPPSHPPPPHSPPPPSHSPPPPPPSHPPPPHSPPPPPPSHSPPPSSAPSPSSGSTGSCPRDALKLSVCATVLHNLINVTLGTPAKSPCCTLIEGLVDLEVSVCFCTALKADILGINIDIPIALSLLVNFCGKNVPSGYQCS